MIALSLVVHGRSSQVESFDRLNPFLCDERKKKERKKKEERREKDKREKKEREREREREREKKEKKIINKKMENRLQRQPGPFKKIISSYSYRRASAGELILHYSSVQHGTCIASALNLDDANDATLVPDQKSDEAEELTESAPQTQEQSHRCGPQRLSCIAGGEC